MVFNHCPGNVYCCWIYCIILLVYVWKNLNIWSLRRKAMEVSLLSGLFVPVEARVTADLFSVITFGLWSDIYRA